MIVEDKYEYLIEQEENGNLKITYQGEVGKLDPRIKNIEATSSSNKIEVKVTAVRTDKYVFYIKLQDETDYTKKEENTTGEYTFVNLEQGKTYPIKVEAINENGQDEIEINRKTVEMTELTQAEVKYMKSTSNWTNQNVTTIVELNTEKDISEYEIQYTKFTEGIEVTSSILSSATWATYSTTGITSTENETIYTRLYDGYNATSYTSTTISNIDKTNPSISTALSSSSVTTKGFTLNIGVTDASSGLSKIIWYYKLSSASSYTSETDTYTTMNGSTAGTKTAVTKTKAFDNLASGTYSAYAVVYDVAGNSITSETISITLGTVATASGATASPTTWTNGKVTVTLPTQDGYTTQYQTGSTTGTWSTYSSALSISSNTTVYYRYNDGTNAGTYASKSISNIDTTKPTISTALSSSTSSIATLITLSVEVVDSNSGLSKIVWYYKPSSATAYTSTTDTYTEMNGSTAGTKTSVTKTKQITELTSETTYNAYAKVYDVAGNSVDTSKITFTTPKAVASVGTNKYISATKAIEAISSSDTVVMLTDSTENLTIPSGKTINLNTSGYTITGTVTNNGTLNISGTGKITSTGTTITNAGTLTSTSATIDSTATGADLMFNTGSITINSGTITSTYTGILSSGTLILKGGTYSMEAWYINNQSSGEVQISGGNYTSKNNNGLINYGTTTISGSSVFNDCKYAVLWNAGTLNLTSGTVTADSTNAIMNRSGATCIMSGGTISVTNFTAIMNYGSFTATGGSISSTTNAVATVSPGTASISSSVTVTGKVY